MTIGLGVAAAPLEHDDRELAVVGAGEGGGCGEFAGATELEGVELGGGDAEDLGDLVDVVGGEVAAVA